MTTALRDEARGLLAWDDVANDQETLKRLDDAQKQQLTTSQKKAARDLREAVWRAYRYVILLAKDNSLKEIDLGLVHSSMAASTTELIVNRLRQDDEITDSVGPNKLVRYWPGSVTTWSTKAARDAFFSSPLLPRLLDGGAIRRTIADAVTQRVLAYGIQRADGTLDPIYFGTPLSESDIDISDDAFLLTAEEAVRRIEPPRLAILQIHPPTARIQVGGRQSFSIVGQDQHGQPFSVEDVAWSATLGALTLPASMSPGATRAQIPSKRVSTA